MVEKRTPEICNHERRYSTHLGWWNCIDCTVTHLAEKEQEEMPKNSYEVSDTSVGDFQVTYPIPATASEELRYILDDLMAEWRIQFTQANLEYGANDHLGVKGAIPDLQRKMGKLRRGLWEGIELKREQPREVAMDMIGHLFILLYLIDQEEGTTDGN